MIIDYKLYFTKLRIHRRDIDCAKSRITIVVVS